MGKYQSYSDYANPGTDWLGDIPSHWKTKRLGALFNRKKETGFTDEELLSVYRDYGVIPKASREDNFNKPSDDLSPYQLVEPGDLVLNKMKTWQGSIAVSEHRGIVSPAYFTYRPGKHLYGTVLCPKYVHYLVRSPLYIAQYLRLSKGIRVNQWDLDPDTFKTLELVIPPHDEQEAVAAFLDHETAKIDRLIDKQERLIDLLKEKRQAMISHAVTTSSHSDPVKLGYFIDLLPGYAFLSASFSHDDSDMPLLRGINVGVDEIRWDETVYWPKSNCDQLHQFALTPGDLVFGMDRPWISGGARVAEVSRADVPCLLLQRVCRLRARKGLVQKFLKLILSSREFKNYVETDLTGVSVPHISPDQIGSFRIRLPSEEQQHSVCEFIEGQFTKIQTTTSKADEAIRLMREHRAALISAAVTGKIDVRGWRAPGSAPEDVVATATA